jgi:3-methyladenine DNA glycosylase AlkD
MKPSVARIRALIRERADPARVPVLQSFFKTGPGQYAAGDVFIGVTVPDLRTVCRECRGATLAEIEPLLRSEIHEERLLALLLLVDAFKTGADDQRGAIYRFYLANTAFINSWDLVDSSASQIVGAWLEKRSRATLTRLARSRSLWERRIAIIATHHFIRRGEFDDTFRIADLLLGDDHDLIHKAAGWMLREVGNRDGRAEREYLKTRCARMPRTMLRYAIEKFPEAERRRYLASKVDASSAGVSTKSSSPRKASSAKRKPKP